MSVRTDVCGATQRALRGEAQDGGVFGFACEDAIGNGALDGAQLIESNTDVCRGHVAEVVYCP